jgi:DNA-binding CsgD family transcriptional regulator
MRTNLEVVGPPRAHQQLVGRAAELDVLAEALNQVRSGRLAVVTLEGEAGIGKTRLLEHALGEASRLGMQIAAGHAEELERNRPFGVLAAALGCTPAAADPRRAGIAAMLSTPGSGERTITVTSDPGLQFLVADAFGDLVHELALTRPLILGVDDLQWADPSTLLTLGAIARGSGVPIGLIVALRPTPRMVELDHLLAALEVTGAQRVAVGPLSDEAVRTLVSELITNEPGPELLSEVSGTSGNPLYVAELLGALIEEGAIHVADGRAELTRRAMPPTLRLTILRRLSFLSGPTLQALRMASVLGSRFSLTDLATVTDEPAFRLSQALREAISAGVLGDDGERLRFRHDLIRDAIYADVAPSVLRSLHREAGRRLAHAGAPALQVAEHLWRGATTGDREATEWLTRAARDIVSRSPASAAALLDRAVAMSGPADPDRDQLIMERAGALLWAGQVSEAAGLCRQLLGHAVGSPYEARARICLGHALLTGGRPRDAFAELARVDDAPGVTQPQRAAVLGWQSVAQIWLADVSGAAESAEQALTSAELAGDDLVHAIATTMLSVVGRLRGRLNQAAQISEQTVRRADRTPNRRGHRYPVLAPRAYALIELDRLDEARAAVETGVRISEELGTAWHLPSFSMVSAVGHYTSGEWDEAVNDVNASLELAGATGEAYGIPIGLSLSAAISLHRNDLPRAREVMTDAVRRASDTEDRYGAQRALEVQALVLEADGRIAEAYATLVRAWDACTRLGLFVEYRPLGPDLVRLALLVGDRDRARQVAAAVTALAAGNEVVTLTATAMRCRGLAENDPDLLGAAALLMGSGPRPLEHALSCEDAGTAFVRHGDFAQGRPLLEDALKVYERLDATRDIGRAEATLREAGVRRGRRASHRRARSGWASLTETEQTVAALVAEGLSNPQIGRRLYVSSRTVQTHLAHVFGKLDIGSRAELAVLVATRRAASVTPGETKVSSR